MGMVVRTNTMALNAFRQLNNNNSAVAKSLEKLSSGFRINRAADDASGLAISEKMKAQIKGLEQASSNSQDGISLVQTAEGATQEIHNMLNRMVELAVKSANGTIQNEVDREAIQAEVDALLEEIDRIADSTNFNGIKLLNGDLSGDGAAAEGVTAPVPGKPNVLGGETTTVTGLTYADGLDDAAKTALNEVLAQDGIKFTLSNGGAAADTIAVAIGDGSKYTVDALQADGKTPAAKTADLAKLQIKDKDGNVVATLDAKIENADTDGDIVVKFEAAKAEDAEGAGDAGKTRAADGAGDADDAAGIKKGDAYTIDFSKIANPADNETLEIAGVEFTFKTAGDNSGIDSIKIGADIKETMNNLKTALDAAIAADPDDAALAGLKNFDLAAKDGVITLTAKADDAAGKAPTLGGTWTAGAGAEVVPPEAESGDVTEKGLILQVGDTNDEWNKISVSVDSLKVASLFGKANNPDAKDYAVDVSSAAAAGKAINSIKDAINTVSTNRANLGAVQNRLEYTINNLDTTAENMSAANSRIRDTDMAKEMMAYTKMNVLTQSAQAMLAQANQQPQSILQLLQ